MNTKQYRITVSLTAFVLFLSVSLHAQDTLSTKKPMEYSTVSFQISQVSGIGISYGRNLKNGYRFRITGSVLSTGDNLYFSFGTDYEYELTKNKPFRVFIGPALGTWGISSKAPHLNVALGTGMETPITGNEIFENVTAGVEIYYPTFSFQSGTIGIAGGVFISYNF
jgi:hypothetical protein